MDKIRFEIFTNNSAKELAREIEWHLNNDWELRGSPYYNNHHNIHCQAMIRL